jgi:hypothetical protein
VLNDNHRVAQIAQPDELGDQPLVVALVQPDGRLVQHVQHAHQPGADLRRQADALRLPARQRPALAIQREIVQPHIGHKPQPAPISRSTSPAISCSWADNAQVAKNSCASNTDILVTSTIERPLTVQAMISGRRRAPPHSGQGVRLMYGAGLRVASLSVVS